MADSLSIADSLAGSSTPAPSMPPAAGESSSIEPPSPLALRGHGRPHPLKAAWKAAGNGASDMVYLYTTPLRMKGSNLLALGAVAGTGAAIYAFDEDIHRGFQRSRENRVYRNVVIDAGGFFEPLGLITRTNVWLQGAAVAGWVLDVPLLRTIPVEILESNFIVGSLRQPIEQIVGRKRPSDGEGPHQFFKSGDSFPSGHASVVWESAAILSHHFRHPVARAGFWGIATVACLQRVDEPGHNHWPSDVWFGAALGAYSGHTIARRNEERRRGVPQAKWYDVLNRAPSPGWSVHPMIGPDGSGLTVRTAF